MLDVISARLFCIKGNMALAGPSRLLALAVRLLLEPRRNLVVRGSDQSLPVVRVPRALQRRQEQRQSGRGSLQRPVLVRPGPLLVSARRPDASRWAVGSERHWLPVAGSIGDRGKTISP